MSDKAIDMKKADRISRAQKQHVFNQSEIARLNNTRITINNQLKSYELIEELLEKELKSLGVEPAIIKKEVNHFDKESQT